MRLAVGCNVCDGVVVNHQHICAVALLEQTSVLELELMGRNAGTLGDGSLEVAELLVTDILADVVGEGPV